MTDLYSSGEIGMFMLTRSHYKKLHCTILFSPMFALSACGGGGGGGDDIETGQLLDSPVSGVSYFNASQSGVTDANGNFTYKAGETVAFSLGGTVLGTSTAKTVITLFDLVLGAEVVVGNRAVEDALYGSDDAPPLQAVISAGCSLCDSKYRPKYGSIPTYG